MKKITKREVCLSVPDRWAAQYENTNNVKHQEIAKRLHDLPTKLLTPEGIAAVIGNESWTRLECDECERDAEQVAEVAGKLICYNCVNRALALL